MKHWFGLVCFLIVYGSFYPFSFSSGAPSDAHLLALLDFNVFRAGLADAVSNIVLFIPYGYLIASVLKASSAKHAILKTLLPTFAFAYAVQIGQLWVDGRLPWGGDAILNVLGYMIGLVLYLYFSRHFSIRFKVETPIQKVVTFAIATLVLIKLAPFVPSLDMEQLKQSIKQILLRPQVDLFWVFENVVSWLLVFYLSKQFVFKDLPLRAYAKLVIAILCFKFFLVSNNLNLDALLGGLLALAIWWRIGRLLNTQALLILTGCAILGNGLYPFEFSTSASPFNWLPFSGSLAGNVLLNILAVSKKLAFYVCFIVLLMQTKANKYAVFCIPASLVAVSEILQVFVPGSVPESTDVVMVCFLVFVLRRYLGRLTVAEHAGYTPNGCSENEVASNSDAHVTRRKHTDGHHYIAGLDGLRAIAAMSVFVVHFQQFSDFQYSLGWLDFTLLMVNGNTGVALFFVLSGFLLSQPFWRAYQRRTSVALKPYFTNRLARIVPIYYLLFFFLIAIKGFAGPEVNFNNILSHLFFVHNFKDQQVMSLNPPFWTLAVEMQFYLLLPLLFVLLGKLRRISGFWIVLGLVALIYAIYRFGVVWLGHNVSWPISFPLIWPFGVFAQSVDSPAVTYSTLAHLPHFLMGVATSYLFLSNKNFSKKRLADIIVIISSISVVAVLSTNLDSFLTLDFGRYNFPFIPMMLCLIDFFVNVSGVCRQLLELRTIRWLGRISYGLYIFHYPAQKAMLKAMNYLDISMQSNQWLFFTASLLITVLAAYVSYEVIEKPVMRYFKPSVENAVTLSASPAQTQSSRVIRSATISRHHISIAVMSIVVVGTVVWMVLSFSGNQQTFVRQANWAGNKTQIVFDHHAHTTYSDGSLSLGELVELAYLNGCEAMSVTDHSNVQSSLTQEKLIEIEELRNQYPGMLIFSGIELGMPSYMGREHVSVIASPDVERTLLPTLMRVLASSSDVEKNERDQLLINSMLSSGEYNDQFFAIYNHPSRKDKNAQENIDDITRWNKNGRFIGSIAGAPGHQNQKFFGSYREIFSATTGWDPVVTDVGGTWDKLLSKGIKLWGAIASSDFHNERMDYPPCSFSRIHVTVDTEDYGGVLRGLKQGTFWADHGHLLDKYAMYAEVGKENLTVFPGGEMVLSEKDSFTLVNVELARGKAHYDSFLRVDLITNCLDGDTEIQQFYLAPEDAKHQVLVPFGESVEQCFIRSRVIKESIDERVLGAYSNPIFVKRQNHTVKY